MTSKPTTIAGTIENAQSLIEALRQINPEMKIRGEPQSNMVTKLERYNAITSQQAAMDAQNILLMSERNSILEYFNNLAVTTREVIAGDFGKNSDQYKLVGGTRTSDIVRRGGRKSKKSKNNTVKPDGDAAPTG